MSYAFDVEGVTVWSPALRVGSIFVGYLRVLEQVVGTPAGFTANGSDMVKIDLLPYAAFLERLLQMRMATGHEQLVEMIDIVLVPSLVIIERGGAGGSLEIDRALSNAAAELSRSMPWG